MAGLFVQKHAIAVAKQGVEVCVLHFQAIGANSNRAEALAGRLTDDTTTYQTGYVREIIVYYNEGKIGMLRAMARGYRYTMHEWGLPDLMQVNTICKGAFLARAIRIRHGIPYLIVEHWSAYLPENGTARRWSGLKKQLYTHIYHHAEIVMPVSQYLQDHMFVLNHYQGQVIRIENVVGEEFEAKTEVAADSKTGPVQDKTNRAFRFLHVSCFDERSKNVCGLLRAFKAVSLQHPDVVLDLIGTGPDILLAKEQARQLHFPEGMVRFAGEQSPHEVAKAMHEDDAFVLFSRYENAPVVLSESIVCGLPIVSSKAGGIPEMVPPQVGLLVDVADEAAMAQAMIQMKTTRQDYCAETIQAFGDKYKEQQVGEKLVKIYRRMSN